MRLAGGLKRKCAMRSATKRKNRPAGNREGKKKGEGGEKGMAAITTGHGEGSRLVAAEEAESAKGGEGAAGRREKKKRKKGKE